MGWIRIHMDPELLPGSGTLKIQSWIRIRNKSFRIHKVSACTMDLMDVIGQCYFSVILSKVMSYTFICFQVSFDVKNIAFKKKN